MPNAWPGLPILSHPRREEEKYFNDEAITNAFFNYKNAGEGAVVYVVDTGCDIRHPGLQGVKIKDWLSGGRMPIEKGHDQQEYHGTQIVFKIASRWSGIAPLADLIVSTAGTYTGLHDVLAVFDALLKVYEHIRKFNSNKPCILNLSLDIFGNTFFLGTVRSIIKEVLQLLAGANVIIVQSAGNVLTGEDGKQTPVTFLPSLKSDPIIKEWMVVVGAANLDHFDGFDSNQHTTVWAPGEGVYSPVEFDLWGMRSQKYQYDYVSGTSIGKPISNPNKFDITSHD
ncbi:hypothetical protein ABW19_dt0203807 [Dactylella cylindrospora]|nr:hypothetical protein ABW19_dt0203807 [Dactylella cylindrospora]